ncbi:PAS domain-containing sensor histidine kinase [Diaphorobacter sp. HDW4B]|uniref:sensor histidine kinase n=1 Tax=Diaphorobacter sp. HDW4B TaxID=2714925 RepID=UPI001F0F746E|nr:ATP-binding protein [Diaphorobacter sp. HDW4B]
MLHSPRIGNNTFLRIWLAFLNGRVMVALLLAMQQGAGLIWHLPTNPDTLAAALGYLALTLAVRIVSRNVPSPQPGPQWLPTIGVDIALFSYLQFFATDTLSFMPLFALPVLMAGMLGTLMTALGTTSVITIVLLVGALWFDQRALGDPVQRYVQAALTGVGFFIVTYLAHQLSVKLRTEHEIAQRSRMAAQTQEDVSALVMQHLSEGVLVMDRLDQVRLANPSARLLMGDAAPTSMPFDLRPQVNWSPLLELVRRTFDSGTQQSTDLDIAHPGHSPMGLRVRTWLTSHHTYQPTSSDSSESTDPLCVVFLQDLREMEARLRTEKLAAMGRMSAAVAHEIRNPLAAIIQANALLEEDLTDAMQLRLSQMVKQNADRLTRITEEVLDIARVRHQIDNAPAAAIALDNSVAQIFGDWQTHDAQRRHALLTLHTPAMEVNFEIDHLRRVLVNLMDNALRYMGPHPDSMCIHTSTTPDGLAFVQVWSDGAPLEKSVEQHLFEPFFSSESRSSGLGLYICRELCSRHGASIRYERSTLTLHRGEIEGNAFIVTFRKSLQLPGTPSLFDTIMV